MSHERYEIVTNAKALKFNTPKNVIRAIYRNTGLIFSNNDNIWMSHNFVNHFSWLAGPVIIQLCLSKSELNQSEKYTLKQLLHNQIRRF